MKLKKTTNQVNHIRCTILNSSIGIYVSVREGMLTPPLTFISLIILCYIDIGIKKISYEMYFRKCMLGMYF